MIQNIINNQLIKDLHNQLDNLIVEGLKLKGFEFENKQDLEAFLKERCKRTDNIDHQEHVYYVDDIPFFLHRYESVYSPITQDDNGIRMSANFGSYCFLP